MNASVPTTKPAACHRHDCPACGRRVAWSRVYLRNWLWARWNCEGCDQRLGFDMRRRWLMGLVLLLWCLFCQACAGGLIFYPPHLVAWGGLAYLALFVPDLFCVLGWEGIVRVKADVSVSAREISPGTP